jgi:hypothetical protein
MHGSLLVAQVLALAWVAHLTSFAEGFPLDDAWIHQVVGRTFARTGVIGYTPERFGSATTSLLWATLIAANHAWLHLAPAFFAFVINSALFVATGQLWLAMLRRDGAPDGLAFGCAVFAATAANFVWFALSGMESMLLVFLSTTAIWLWVDRGRRPSLRAWGSGLAVALVFLTRPEAAAILVVLAVMLQPARRPWRDLFALAIPCLLAVSGYALAMATATGDVRPSTLEGRKAIWFQEVPTASSLELGGRMLIVWRDRLAAHTLPLSASDWEFWVVVGLSLGGLYVVARRRWIRFRTLVLWGAAHIIVYLVLFPTAGHGGRYQPLTPALFLGLAWVGVYVSVAAAVSRFRWPPASRPLLFTSLALLMGLGTARSLSAWSRAHRDAVKHIWNTEVAMGRFVAQLPPSAVVASFDIGGVGFFSDREIIDLGALVDSSVAGALRRSEAWAILEERQVDYVVVPEGYTHDFPDPWNFYYRLGLHKRPEGLVPITRFESDRATWRRGLEASLHAAPAQVLYRVETAP